MRIPIDIPAVLKEATDINAAASMPLSVNVYIDETAAGDVVAFVRSSFASPGANTRVQIAYLTDEVVRPGARDDMACVVAGVSETIGAQVAALRAAGTPTMVVTTMPTLVRDMAAAFGSPIPEGDILFPAVEGDILSLFDKDDAEVAPQEPLAFDARAKEALAKRMGEWVIAVCHDKRLACALSFPFVRRPLSVDAVNTTAIQNAGVGVVAFIPGADMPIMTLNQAKMLLQISAAYGQPMSAERVKELAAVVGGAFVLRGIARQAVAVVPLLGWAIKGAIGYAGTEAMGRAAIEYFEAGGDAAGLSNVIQKARNKAVEVVERAAATPTGQKVVVEAQRVADTVLEYAQTRA